MEPGVGQFAVRAEYQAAGVVHSLANPVVNGLRRVGLGLGYVGGDLRAGVFRFLLADELQDERAREYGLGLQRLHGPVVAHLAGEHAHNVVLDGDVLVIFGSSVVDGDDGRAVPAECKALR